MPWIVLRLLALKSWLSSRTKNLVTKRARVGIIVFVFSLLLHPTPVHAAPLWVESIVQSFAYIAFTIAAAITQGIVLLIDVMVPIMTYNNFVGNPVVRAGWAIVRDTVNMFFVVILIIIAFGTIFGSERFKWQQQVPRLLVMAIVVNFSKTLCGIMIDFGQVIMLTFANALREIAAGNFIQLLGLNKIYQVSQASSVIDGVEQVNAQGASQAFDFFGSAVLSVLLTIWVFATLLILVSILLFRIIMLWVLVVIAPLAWFMKGAKGIIDSNAYEDWWKEFKCLVGIGPVLTFFLWLTLAVAGAGNIAANSGFDVSANSNNADFTASWLEVNNFLSFLIGMGMLFAGFKAASQFCSAGIAGGFIGKRLETAKAFSPEKVARFGAGVGLKAGGYVARLGGRAIAGTPGAAAAASRYLPPAPAAFQNIPSRAKAAVAGRVADMAGEGAIGRFFKGKQADIQQGIRATKFDGVNKEKEAMKNKDRNWKQGQLEAMLKSPPKTQAGKDKMAALFEETMADGRLQKDLLRKDPEAMKKLWAIQGKGYTEMSNGNVAKTAELDSFKKKYAHITGSTDRIKDADDTKALAAGAWEDSAVQGRAAGIRTTFRDKDGKNLNALEAARAGHYGIEAQQAAVKGTDVTKLDIGTQVEGQFEAALQMNDRDSADAVIAQMRAKYTDAGTSDQDRQKMALSMDRMRAAADKMGKGGNATAVDSLTAFDTARTAMETQAGFGLPPAPAAGQGADTYVDENFGQSSGERIDAAMSQIESEKTAAQGAVAALEGEVQALRGVEKTIADKEKQIADVRKRIQQSVEGDRKQAYQPLRRARKNLAVAQQKGNANEIARAQKELDKFQASYDKVVQEGDEEMKGSPDITSLEAEVKKMIDDAGGKAGLEAAKEKSRRLQELQEQADRLEKTRVRLVQERNKRTT
ncbi:hypothetical protein HY626_01680 [Candidatus Uhrbacteria bacterium]|nr:hypothetical protein [Candidatus Uhrbacteria bacterium]